MLVLMLVLMVVLIPLVRRMIMVAYLRYNRFILYDGRRLHNQYFTPEQYKRLTGDPNSGRLTMNSFFWTRA